MAPLIMCHNIAVIYIFYCVFDQINKKFFFSSQELEHAFQSVQWQSICNTKKEAVRWML